MLHAKYKIGTVKLFYSHEALEALKNPAITAKIQVIANPRFWQFENCRSSFSFKGDKKEQVLYTTNRSSSGMLYEGETIDEPCQTTNSRKYRSSWL